MEIQVRDGGCVWTLLFSQGQLIHPSGLHCHDSPKPGHPPEALPAPASTSVMRYKVSIMGQRGQDHVVGGDSHWLIDTAHAAASPEASCRARASSGALASVAAVASRRKEEIASGKCNG